MDNNIITTVIVTIASGVVTFIVKGYITDLKEQLKNHKDETSKTISKINERVDKIQEGYTKILDEILMKFSRWEDRISKILNDIVKSNFQNTTFTDFANRVESDLKSSSTLQVIGTIKEEMNVLEKELNDLSSKMDEGELKLRNVDARTRENYYDLLKYTKNSIFEIKEKLKVIEALTSKELVKSNELTSKLYMVIKKLNEDFVKFRVQTERQFEAQMVRIKLK